MAPLAQILVLLINIYILVLFARAVLSWLRPDPRHPVVRFLDRVTDPVLEPIRRRLGLAGPVDFSPLIVIILLILLKRVVIYLL